MHSLRWVTLIEIGICLLFAACSGEPVLTPSPSPLPDQPTTPDNTLLPGPGPSPMPTLASSPTSTLTDRWTVYVTGIDTAFDNRIVSGISEQVIRGGLSEQILIEERDDAEVLDRWTENRDDLGADLWLMIRGIDDQQFLIIPTTPLTSPPLFRHDQAVIPWMSLLSGEPVLFLSQSDSTDIVEQFVLGLYAMHIEDYGIAETHFKRAQGLSLLLDESTHRNLNEGTLGVFIGAAQVGQGNATDALATFSRASRQSPELLSVYVNRAGAYLQLGDSNAALADLDRVVNQKADDPFVHYNMALALFSLGNDTESLSILHQLKGSYPGLTTIPNTVGLVYLHASRLEEAIEQFNLVLEQDPSSQIALSNLAEAYLQRNDLEAAEGIYVLLMEADPENADYRYMSGSILLNLGLEVEALQRFEEVIPLRPEWLDPYLQIAGIHASHGNWVEVLSQAERAIEIAPERPEGYAYQGESLLAQDEFRLARDAFSEAIERGVHTPFVYLNRAWARHNLRDISGALSDYDRGFETPPDDSIWWYRYGFALFDGARYRESVDAFEAAQENGMDTADLYAGLALALDATIQRTAAEEVYLRAVSLEPEFSDPGFLSELSLWTQSSVNRAEAILRRIEASN